MFSRIFQLCTCIWINLNRENRVYAMGDTHFSRCPAPRSAASFTVSGLIPENDDGKEEKGKSALSRTLSRTILIIARELLLLGNEERVDRQFLLEYSNENESQPTTTGNAILAIVTLLKN